MNILIINGPNLNLLGMRNTKVYGSIDMQNILEELKIDYLDINIDFFQSNSESDIVNKMHTATNSCQGIVINPGAFTHTSVAIRDAIEAIDIPVVEVHLSNIFARSKFRSISLIAPVCKGTISGFGAQSYNLAIKSLLK
jgi:3-dehydroquinate dehydratase-2